MTDLDDIRQHLDNFDRAKAGPFSGDKEAEHLHLDLAAWAIIRAYRAGPSDEPELDTLTDRLLQTAPPTEWGWYA
jgi:hypothetical protein